MNYEEALKDICEEKKYIDLFEEDRGLKEIKNFIKKIAIQNENMNQIAGQLVPVDPDHIPNSF